MIDFIRSLFAKPHRHDWVVTEFLFRRYPQDSDAKAVCVCGATLVAFGSIYWFDAKTGERLDWRNDEPFRSAWRLHEHSRSTGMPVLSRAKP